MASTRIVILGTYFDGKLRVTNDGNATIKSWENATNRHITWSIDKEATEVNSILIKPITPGNPFETPIPTVFDNEIKLRVNKDQPAVDWKYCLRWKDQNGKEHDSDPIIAIKSRSISPFNSTTKTTSLIVLVLGIIGLTWLFWDKIKDRND